jgi:hypothetical protein|tara:strand:- start:79 stop:723 length:645 start_codon:yes stop_codon:yes gene_type:complete
MTTFNIETTLPTGKLHKRQTGLWGQLLASSEIEAKLARVEPLYKELHGRNLSRTAFFTMCREIARESKTDAGGYLQYMTQDVAGVILREWHTQIGKEVRRNRKLKNTGKRSEFIVSEIGKFNIQSNDFMKNVSGKRTTNGFVEGSKVHKLYTALLNRKYPVTKETLMKDADMNTPAHFYVSIRDLRLRGHDVQTLGHNEKGVATSVSPKYQLVG